MYVSYRDFDVVTLSASTGRCRFALHTAGFPIPHRAYLLRIINFTTGSWFKEHADYNVEKIKRPPIRT